jgi:hypothetical protein
MERWVGSVRHKPVTALPDPTDADINVIRHDRLNDLLCPMVADMILLFAAALVGRTRRMARW